MITYDHHFICTKAPTRGSNFKEGQRYGSNHIMDRTDNVYHLQGETVPHWIYPSGPNKWTGDLGAEFEKVPQKEIKDGFLLRVRATPWVVIPMLFVAILIVMLYYSTQAVLYVSYLLVWPFKKVNDLLDNSLKAYGLLGYHGKHQTWLRKREDKLKRKLRAKIK